MNVTTDFESTREQVRRHYARIVTESNGSCCGPTCCTAAPGYSEEERTSPSSIGNLGLGCGNPGLIAGISSGETVIDLGSGAGFDSFLAARAVGPAGRVIGVDMTPEMVERARANGTRLGLANVEFVPGRIEALPLPDGFADLVISNCVVNLSPEKARVYEEAYRVLRSGGRLAIADVLAIAELPPALRADAMAYCECISGAATVTETRRLLEAAGFVEVSVDLSKEEGTGEGAGYVRAALICARKRSA